METIEEVKKSAFDFKKASQKEFQTYLDKQFPGLFKVKIFSRNMLIDTNFDEFVDSVVDLSCEFLNVSKEGILGKSRLRPIPEYRAMMVAYIYDTMYIRIRTFKLKRRMMRYFNRDHAMFAHCIKTHENLVSSDKEYKNTYFRLKLHLENTIN